ncbi:hydroxymethylbilane synthase [Isoptericola croceus]|uniref:hydroxymethylbilane synthase n=1 Tax=Isoptericola croceus TaxID=3031406 RepID=UPI0023F6F231|nr:hydroxymethylbilane synthase [Isoptericola croceus]
MRDNGAVTTPAPAPLRLGTRGSALATTQSGLVARRLETLLDRPVELVRIKTEGDVKTGSLASLGGTGVFVTALRDALANDLCDIAVHSLKDLPTTPAPGLTYVTPEREDPRDALCARDGLTLDTLPRNGLVGTGSPRRAAQLQAARPDLEIVDIRGNVETRLARALGPEPDLDAVVLAFAGLTRLHRTEVVSEVLDPLVVAPAPGQGALAVEARTDALLPDTAPDGATAGLAAAFAALDHRPTRLSVTAERAVLARLEAGCAAPIGAYARLEDDGLALSAVVASLDGTQQLKHTARVEISPTTSPADADDAARSLGVRVAERLLVDGAARLAPLSPAEPAPPEPARAPTGTDDPEGA